MKEKMCSMEKLTCSEAKQFDLVEYMASLGHHPQKIRNQDYWYRSPLRDEKTASFKVDRRQNIWYDHGLGKGGDLVDFGTLYFKCTIKELLEHLSTYRPSLNLSFHPPLAGLPPAGEKKGLSDSRIVILEARPLFEKSLTDYLKERSIPLDIASRFCKEVDFLLYSKNYRAIGFQNNAGGYELRSPDFKGSSSPKSITFQDNGSKELCVFEGFFNYLSFLAPISKQSYEPPNFLILNSAAFFQSSKEIMEQHEQVSLFLDRDKTGIRCTQEALQWDEGKYLDRSSLYKDHKDLNQWLIIQPEDRKQYLRSGKGFGGVQ